MPVMSVGSWVQPTGQALREPLDLLAAGGSVPDRVFDRALPRWARPPSRTHFTPVAVARRAAELLVATPGARVLDVGAGIGKFCIVGAVTTDGYFVGVEQRRHLVEAATALVRACGVERCRFVHGDAFALDWTSFQGFYFFNPFTELLPGMRRLDRTLPQSAETYRRYVQAVEERLELVAPGTRVVTYHGFGGKLCPDWSRQLFEHWGPGPLELWVKQPDPG
jgi:SAM-dependent methyltransferase